MRLISEDTHELRFSRTWNFLRIPVLERGEKGHSPGMSNAPKRKYLVVLKTSYCIVKVKEKIQEPQENVNN